MRKWATVLDVAHLRGVPSPSDPAVDFYGLTPLLPADLPEGRPAGRPSGTVVGVVSRID